MVLQRMLERLEAQRTEASNVNVDTLVQERINQLLPKIREEIEHEKAEAIKVVDIKIEAINEAIAEEQAYELSLANEQPEVTDTYEE